MKRIVTATTASALLIGGTAVAVVGTAAPASADLERRGACSTGVWELSVDREGRGFDVAVDFDRLPPGSTWSLRLLHEGRTVSRVTRTVDAEGEMDVERYRPDTRGKDRFRFVAARVGGGTCRGSLTTR